MYGIELVLPPRCRQMRYTLAELLFGPCLVLLRASHGEERPSIHFEPLDNPPDFPDSELKKGLPLYSSGLH